MKHNSITAEELKKLVSALDAHPPKRKDGFSTARSGHGGGGRHSQAMEKGYSVADIAEHFGRFRLTARLGTISVISTSCSRSRR